MPPLLRRLRNLYGVTARKGMVSLSDQAVVSGTNFFTTVLVGRSGGPDELANYALGFTLVITVFWVLDSLIATPYTIYVRRFDEADRAAFLGSVLLQCGMLSALAVFVLAGWGMFISNGLGSGGLSSTLYVLAATIPFCVFRQFARQSALAQLNVKTALQIDLYAGALQIVTIAALAVVGALSAVTAFAASGAANALTALMWLIRSRKEALVQPDQILPTLRRNLAFGSWALMSRFISELNSKFFFMWLIAFLLGKKETGIFAACMTVVNLSNPFVLGIGQVLTPLIAQAFSEKGPQELKRVVLKATIFLGIVLTCFCIGALLFGDEVVKIIYGGEFTDNRWTIFLLAVVALVSALSMPPGFGLLALERPEVNLKASIIGVVITVAAVSTLIFHFKLLGVAGGLLCGFMSILAVHWIVFGRTVAKASINR